MIWKDIKGYEGMYQVSDQGDIKSLRKWSGTCYRKERILSKNRLTKDGYCHVSLVKDGKYSACLATTFIPIDEAEKMGGNFINSNRKFVGYGNDLKISKLEDLTDFEVTVNGEWARG